MFPLETRILIVDDMPAIREMVRSALREFGYTYLLEAPDGIDAGRALLKAQETDAPIGLIICDWNMPRRNGLEFLKSVRASDDFKTLPFILLTAESEREQVTEAVLAGVSQYIIKPFTPKILKEKMEAVWKKQKA